MNRMRSFKIVKLDPAVVKMAINPDYFSYMQECSYKSDIRIDDARLKLKDVSENSQDYSHIFGTLKAKYKKNARILPNQTSK